MVIKKRSPWLVLLFFIITFGIYGIYWIFSTTKELQENTSSKVSIKLLVWGIVLSILGVCFFGFGIVFASFSSIASWILISIGVLFYVASAIISIIFIWRYSKGIEEVSGFSAVGFFIIWLLVSIAMPVVAQYQLNKKTSGSRAIPQNQNHPNISN